MISHTSTLEFALLGMLHQVPQSGYDLRKFFIATPLAHFSDSPGSIYPALKRMAARGWIRGTETTGSGRGRTVFRPMPAGRSAFRDWLYQTVTQEDVTWSMDELILRFAFLDGYPDRVLGFLEELERALVSHVADLTAYQDLQGADIRGITGRLALTNGVDQYATHLAWSRKAQAVIRGSMP